ncbi:cytochrome P450 [Sorangium sp. So ce1151]|uniref:cytochrome P450 n=1 Tax=Sorangium sp. So ce1151 TaxID=3133332 RepID=UPI003F61971F
MKPTCPAPDETTRRSAGAARPRRTLADLPGPRGLPVIGNLHELHADRWHLEFERWWRAFGDVFVVRMGRQPILVVAEGELVRDVLQRRPAVFRRTRAIEDVSREADMVGLFSADGEAWRKQRQLINPTLHARHVEGFFPSICEITGRLRDLWSRAADERAARDVLGDLMRYSVDVTSTIAFGRDLNTLGGGPDALQEHLQRVFLGLNRRILAPLPYWRYLGLPADRAYDRALLAVKRLIFELVAAARRELEGGAGGVDQPARPRTLLELMIVARDGENPRAHLSDAEVYANVLTMLLAGEDTTANTLAWILYYLASRPDVQARAREEADRVLGGGLIPTLEQSKRLEYTGAVTQETLRLRSAAPLLYLEANHDTVIGDVAVPAGAGVVVLTRATGRKPEYFGDPESFRPERWLGGASPMLPHEPRMALAFGSGPRVCPGRSMALLECAVTVGMVLRSFTVQLADHTAPVRERMAFAMQPEGLRIRFTKRARA